MILSNKKEAVAIAELLEKLRPDIWNFVVHREQEGGAYSEEEEQEAYQFLISLNNDYSTIDVVKLFFTIRCFVSYKLGINTYKEEF